MEADTEGAAADAEFRAILEDRGAHAFLFEERAIGGIQVFQVKEVIADFEHAVVAGDFRISQGKVCAFAADNDARTTEEEKLALFWATGDGEGDVGIRGQVQSLIRRREAQAGRGGVGAGEGRHGGDHDSFR